MIYTIVHVYLIWMSFGRFNFLTITKKKKIEHLKCKIFPNHLILIARLLFSKLFITNIYLFIWVQPKGNAFSLITVSIKLFILNVTIFFLWMIFMYLILYFVDYSHIHNCHENLALIKQTVLCYWIIKYIYLINYSKFEP